MGFWNKFFGGNQEKSNSHHGKLSWVGWDMHNHILPGIDDGCKDLEASKLLIAGLKELGINKCVCTPHVMNGVHNNTPETIERAYKKLQEALVNNRIDFQLEYSAEYMIDDQLDSWIQSNNLCLIGGKYMLIEMSYLSESKALFSIIKEIQQRGFQPILAHPERYNYYHNNFKIFEEIKQAGCYLQMNLLSISKYYGEGVKTCALTLARAGMYDLVGTDMHHTRHLEALKNVVQKYDIQDILSKCEIKNTDLFKKVSEARIA